jgi:hypothetical protein
MNSSVADVLAQVRRKGVRLWSEQGQLRYQAPRGALTSQELETLRLLRQQVVAHLEKASNAGIVEPRLDRRTSVEAVPLTYSQRSHWDWYDLGERPNVRQIASAIRLQGRLDIDALQRSVEEMFRRHEALRTRIIAVEGGYAQEVFASDTCTLEYEDLSYVTASLRESEVQRRIAELILEPVDVTMGPLVGLKLLRLGEREHVVIVALEHIISDMFSLKLLLQDLFAAYKQAVKGVPFSLPRIAVQFADFALWQHKAQEAWLGKHGTYWRERLAGCGRLRFPADRDASRAEYPGWGTAPVQIGGELKAELLEWCRSRRTTPALAAFAAYVALVLRWCNASEVVVQYVSEGRVNPKVHNTIGSFAFLLSVRVGLSGSDRLSDLMSRAMAEYCQAYEHADCGYVEAQQPRPDYVRNCGFNWLSEGSSTWATQQPEIDLYDLEGSDDAIVCLPVAFEHPILQVLDWDREPFLLLFDTGERIMGSVHFPLNRFSLGMMECFASNFPSFLAKLIREPQILVKDMPLI